MATAPLVLVASGDAAVHAACAVAIGAAPGELLGAASSDEAAVEARDRDPQVVLVDLRWPVPRPSGPVAPGSRWDWLEAIAAAAPRSKVVLLASPELEAAGWELVARGALDCLPVDAPAPRLAASLHNALARAALEREGTAWREIRALLDVSHAVTAGEELGRTLQRIMDSAMQVTGADSGSLMLWAGEGEEALEIAASRGLPTGVVAGTRVRPGDGVAGYVARTGEPVLIRDGLGSDPRFRHLTPRERIRSSLCVPVRSRPGAVIGVLCLNTEQARRRLSPRDLSLMTIYAGAVGTLIEAARALEAQRTSAQRLERSLRRLRHTEAQLIQAGKMAALGLLASGVAHEFNNLLTGILGMAQIAQETGKPEHREKALRVAVENCRRARDVVKNLLSFARPYSSPNESVDLVGAIENVLGLTQREVHARGVRVVRRLHESAPVAGARGELEQVLLNLILNAVQAMEGRQGGVLTLGLRARREDVVLAVADTGCGIAAEHLPRIFDPFFSTKSLLGGNAGGQGAGLGLSVSLGIIRAHGGRIRVRSRVGRGTVFLIRLPRGAAAAAGAKARPQTRRMTVVGAGARVLVVDDEWWVREFLRECLEHAGFRVGLAGSVAEAREVAEDLAPDVALIDLVLGEGERGTALAATLREARPGLRVVYMTGRLDGGEEEQRVRTEAEGFLAKPFEGADVVAALAHALSEEAGQRAGAPPRAQGSMPGNSSPAVSG